MSFLKRTEKQVVETSHTVTSNYTGAHPVLAFKTTTEEPGNDHLDDYVEVKPFERSEGLGSWLDKTVNNTAKFMSEKKEHVSDHLAKRKSDNAAKTIVAALRNVNKSVDAQLKNAWMVVEKQRRNDKKPQSGDKAAKKKLFDEIRTEIWDELERKRRKNKETEAFDKELLAVFDTLRQEN